MIPLTLFGSEIKPQFPRCYNNHLELGLPSYVILGILINQYFIDFKNRLNYKNIKTE